MADLNNSDAYVELLAEGIRSSIDSFRKTNKNAYIVDFLALLGETKRFGSKGPVSLEALMGIAEQDAAKLLADGTLAQVAASFDLSSLRDKLEFLESISEETEDESQRTLVLLVLDDVLELRDRAHLTITELESRGLSVPKEVGRLLEAWDTRASSNAFVKWGISLPRQSSLYDSHTLGNLWWWGSGNPGRASASRSVVESTPDCPPTASYVAFGRGGWPQGLEPHASNCEYCQDNLAAVWLLECPGWGLLQSYLKDSVFPYRRALEAHLQTFHCGACASKLRLLATAQELIASVGDWISVSWNVGTHEAARAADFSRQPIRILELLDDPALGIEVREDKDSLVMLFTTNDQSLAHKVVEFRLAGQRFETRCEVRLEPGSAGEWLGSAVVQSSEERLRDLSGNRLLSLRLRD